MLVNQADAKQASALAAVSVSSSALPVKEAGAQVHFNSLAQLEFYIARRLPANFGSFVVCVLPCMARTGFTFIFPWLLLLNDTLEYMHVYPYIWHCYCIFACSFNLLIQFFLI